MLDRLDKAMENRKRVEKAEGSRRKWEKDGEAGEKQRKMDGTKRDGEDRRETEGA